QLVGDLLFDIQIEVLNVGRADLLIHGKDVGAGECRGVKDRRARRNRRGRETEQDRVGIDGVVGRPRVESVKGKLAFEKILRERIVEESPAGAQDRLAAAKNIPSKTHTWRKIIQVARLELIDLHQPVD